MRGPGLDDDLEDKRMSAALRALRGTGLTEKSFQAAESLFLAPIQPEAPGGVVPYINGRRRSQAMFDAGVRRTVIGRWEEPDDGHLDQAQAQAVRYLVTPTDQVGRASGRDPMREVLLRLTRGRWPRRRGWPVVPRLGTPWQDTISAERHGWRCRAAYPPGAEDMVFKVDYHVCRRCRLGWVEQPYTPPRYQRRDLARAGLAALRAEHPGLSWHTLGQHLPDGRAFWIAAGRDVAGGYRPREMCPHVTSG